MKTDLLNDIVNEGSYADFRGELEKKFRARVRHQKWKRRSAWMAIAASIALVGLLNLPKREDQVVETIVPPPDVVPTIVTSQMKVDNLLVSAKEPFPEIRTHTFTASVMATDQSKKFPSISDDELLRLFAKRPTGLLAAHGEKRFIFLDPADAKRFTASN